MIKSFDELLSYLKGKGRERIIVAGAEDIEAVKAAKEGFEMGIGEAILVGDPFKINSLLSEIGERNFVKTIVKASTDEEKGYLAVQEAKEKGVLLKGNIKTAILLKAVLDKEWGLRTEKIISDVFVFEDGREDVKKLVLMSDGGVNIRPDLSTLVSIINNAVEVSHKLGNENPLVAIISAVEVVNPDMDDTINASIVSKMNQRGQILGCTIDGPLALDNAISYFAAQKKGIKAKIAGNADILIVPNIVAGNVLGKSINYYAKFRNAHIIVGAKVPVLIPSRADLSDVKFNSIALAIASKM
jgi:phosphate butyryltransferase